MFADGPEGDLIVSAYLPEYEEEVLQSQGAGEEMELTVDQPRDKGKGRQEEWQAMEEDQEEGFMEIDDRDL